MSVQIVFSALVAVGAAWFWLQFARPGLVAVGARPAGQVLVLALTVVLIGIEIIRMGSLVADVAVPATWTISSVTILVWAIVVAFGHPRYGLVLRLTGGPDGPR